MTKPKLFIVVAAGLLLLLAIMTLPFQVGSVQGNWQEQTWPSRTPTPQGGPNPTNTPPPPPPTDDPGGGGGGGGGSNNTPTPQTGPTNTPVVEEFPTLTPNVTVALETPIGGYEATAEPCGTPPTVQALGVVNIRSGPGLEYEPIDSLIYLESRPIVGRAEFATWWLIQLPTNTTGWVANQAVSVQGYTGSVPIVEPPTINGVTPTPGPLWQPTPNPSCTPQPTPTPTNTAVVEAAEPTNQPISNTDPTATPSATATPEPVPPTETIAPEPEPATSTAVPSATADAPSPITEEETPDNESDGQTASASSWILFAGIGLLAVGAVSLIFRRR